MGDSWEDAGAQLVSPRDLLEESYLLAALSVRGRSQVLVDLLK